MIDDFEDKLSWILHDFKMERLNYAEAILKIEEAVDRQLNLRMLSFHRTKDMKEKLRQELKREIKTYPQIKKEIEFKEKAEADG